MHAPRLDSLSLPQFVEHNRRAVRRDADKRRQKPIFVMMHVGNEEGEVRVVEGGNKERKGE